LSTSDELKSAQKLAEALSRLHDNTADNETLGESERRTDKNPPAKKVTVSRFAMAALPTTPLAFNRQDGLAAGLRLGGYSAATIIAFRMKNKPLAYTFAAAAAFSLATSLGATSWQ